DCEALPEIHKVARFRQRPDDVDDEEWTPLDPDVSRVVKRRDDGVEMSPVVVIAGVCLLDQNAVCCSVPRACPVVVCPGEAVRKVGTPVFEHFMEGALKHSASTAKPVVPIAEGMNSVLSGQACLCVARFRKAKVVEAELPGQFRLVVAWVERSRL